MSETNFNIKEKSDEQLMSIIDQCKSELSDRQDKVLKEIEDSKIKLDKLNIYLKKE